MHLLSIVVNLWLLLSKKKAIVVAVVVTGGWALLCCNFNVILLSLIV